MNLSVRWLDSYTWLLVDDRREIAIKIEKLEGGKLERYQVTGSMVPKTEEFSSWHDAIDRAMGIARAAGYSIDGVFLPPSSL